MSKDAIRDYLRSIGYQILFRQREWCECLIVGDKESWRGDGLDADSAFSAAIGRLCPTPLSSWLLTQAAERSRNAAAADLEQVRNFELSAHDSATLDLSSRLVPGLNAQPPIARAKANRTSPDADVLHATAIEPPAPGQVAVVLSRPSMIARATTTNSALTSFAPPSDEATLPDPRLHGSPQESLDALDILTERVLDSREELGLSAPDRQRLAMLAWICEARAHADAFPDDSAIRDRVGALSRLLTEAGKAFWPGSVTALQLHMQPRDLPRHLLGGVATTWHRAAELAEHQLRTREIEDERRGLDAYGWSDAAKTHPRPQNPDAVLQSLVKEIEEQSGKLATQATPENSEIRPDSATFLRWVRTLRWLRGSVSQPELWSRVAGRLRWWAFRREASLAAGTRELESSFVPPMPWAFLLGHDPERRKRDEQLRKILISPPVFSGEDPRAQLVAWIEEALSIADTHHGNIVRALEQHKDLVLALSPELIPDGDRQLRRRFLRVQQDLGADKSASVAVAPIPTDTEPEVELNASSEDEDRVAPGDLREIQAKTSGRRAIFVSHRRDPELQAKLQEVFQFLSLDCRIFEAKRLPALAEAIEQHQYDLVMAATGLQRAGLDQNLARACKRANVPFVRVSHGHISACARAIVRCLFTKEAPAMSSPAA